MKCFIVLQVSGFHRLDENSAETDRLHTSAPEPNWILSTLYHNYDIQTLNCHMKNTPVQSISSISNYISYF